MIAMLVTMTSSATSFLRALDQNINRVPTIYEMVSSGLLDFTLYFQIQIGFNNKRTCYISIKLDSSSSFIPTRFG